MAVRRESVRLSLEDDFTRDMLAAAAATKLLEHNLKDLDGTSVNTGDSVDDLGKSTERGTSSTEENTKATEASTKARDKATGSTKALTLEQALADERTKRLNSTLRDQARASVNAEDGIQGLAGRTREYSLESAIAEERARRVSASLRDEAKAAVDAEQGLDRAASAAERSATSNDVNARSIDRYSGRLGLILKGVALLGPTIAPISVAAVAGLAAITAQAGYAVTGIASVVIAFQGVGDAVKAVEKARLDPTVHNLELARRALQQLGPDAQRFVQHFADLRPVLMDLRNSAASGFFPGMISALDDFERMAPKLEEILRAVAQASGDLVGDAAQSLASPRWAAFLDFLEREAPAAITGLGHVAGSLTHGLAELWMAFDPVNDSFLSWMTQAADSFDRWAGGLSQTQGFQEFLQYLHDTGPELGQALVAISNAILQIGEAAAPLGGPVLHIITELANAIADIADSPLGTPIMAGVTALSALSLASAAATAAVGRLDAALAAMGITGAAAGAEAAGGIAATGAAATAATAGTKRGAASGLIASLGFGGAGAGGALPALSVVYGLLNQGDIFKGAIDGTFSLSDAITRTLVPALYGLDAVGIHLPPWLPGGGGGDDLFDPNGPAADWKLLLNPLQQIQRAANQTTHDIGLTDIATGHFAGTTLSTVGAIDRQIGAMDRLDKAAVRQEKQAAKAVKIWQRSADVIRAQRSALSDAAAGFVDFGHQAKASEFTLDGWFTKLEGQIDAMRNFRENAFKAAENGLDERLIRHLQEMGPEGALQLKRLANAGSAAIERANQDWRSYLHLTGLAGSKTDNLRLKLIDLGHSNASPKIEPKGLIPSLVNLRIAQARMDALGHTSVAPLIREHGSKKVIDAAAAARREVEAIPDKSDTGIHESGGKKVKDSADAARAAVLGIPDKSDTKISEDGAAAVAAAAARARAAVTSIPTSWHTTITTSHIGLPGFADGGTIPGSRFPYGDDRLVPMAGTEEVTGNRYGQADRHRQLLKAINAWRPGMPEVSAYRRGYADGGTVGKPQHALFDGEGPRYYKAAYKHGRPFALDGPAHWDWPYQTTLPAHLAREFEQWVADKGVPFDPSARITDYDMRGFYKKTKGRGWHHGSHFPDTFKTPYDTTFSHESKYATKNNPFYWRGEKLIDRRNGQLIYGSGGSRASERALVGHASRGSERPVGSGGSNRLNVGFEDVRGSVTLDTPWGPQQMEIVARAVARDEITQDRNFQRQQKG